MEVGKALSVTAYAVTALPEGEPRAGEVGRCMVRISQIIGDGFGGSRAAVRGGCGELIESGGRGSGKSSYLSIELILQLLKHPGCHGLVLRKVGATLRTSVYAQLIWAVNALGIGEYFHFSLSPMEAEYLPTGQKILFFGMDDAGKLKSIKMPRGYIGLLWFEELDQFGEEEVRWAEQSVFRGGDFCLSMKSFNPPADPGHWVNRMEDKPGRHRHHSTYLELPEHWLGRRFLEDAAHLKRVNPVLYQHEYLGLAVGTGERVFPNLRLEAPNFDRIRQIVTGVDWGWWPDPWACNRVGYDAQNRVLYVFGEARCFRTSNRETAQIVREMTDPGELIVADSAERKSIADYRALGLNCRGAKKGPGSVAYSVKWLQSLAAIVIDPVACPETAREFASARYVDGALPETENHHIDAVRYAVGHLWRRGG